MKYETTYDSFIIAGALETSTIHVVPKNKAHEAVVKKLPTKMPNQPFEATFRLQVSEADRGRARPPTIGDRDNVINWISILPSFLSQVRLPRNQLYVQRVSPKAKIGDILHQVCKSRDFDESKYELRHPGMYYVHVAILMWRALRTSIRETSSKDQGLACTACKRPATQNPCPRSPSRLGACFPLLIDVM